MHAKHDLMDTQNCTHINIRMREDAHAYSCRGARAHAHTRTEYVFKGPPASVSTTARSQQTQKKVRAVKKGSTCCHLTASDMPTALRDAYRSTDKACHTIFWTMMVTKSSEVMQQQQPVTAHTLCLTCLLGHKYVQMLTLSTHAHACLHCHSVDAPMSKQ